jgi:hypothetical protein
MEGVNLRKVKPGDSLQIPAAAYNAFIDAAIAHRNSGVGGAGAGQRRFRQADIVKVRNDSGSAVVRFGVLGIDAPIILPEDAATEAEFIGCVALSGITPALADHAGRFVILLEPLADGQIGRAWAAGVCQVKINVDEDKDWRYADVADGESGYLEPSNTGSAAILWRAGGTGQQWAVVRLGQGAAEDVVIGRITGSTSIGDNRWRYTFAEVEYLKKGLWSEVPDGITGTAYNTIEANNSASGVQGCGINVDWLPAGVSLKPIGTGAVVELRKRINCETLETEYSFAASNLPDGQCED